MKNENINAILRGEINVLFPYHRKIKDDWNLTNKQEEEILNEFYKG
jgi:hypothetical protein